MPDTVRIIRTPSPAPTVVKVVRAPVVRVVRVPSPAPQSVQIVHTGAPGRAGAGAPPSGTPDGAVATAQGGAADWRLLTATDVGAAAVMRIEDIGVLTGVDDSTLFQTRLTAAAAARVPLRLTPGVTYRAHGITVPAGAEIDARGATVKVPDSVTALNIFNGSSAWTLRGGTFDGNKASTTDGGVNSTSCGIYQSATSAGWSGTVQLLEGPVFQNFHQPAIHMITDITSLTDADNAPPSAAYLDRVEVAHNALIGIRLTGLTDVKLVAPYAHDNGSHGIRTFLCKRPVATNVRSISNTSHGFTSLYCVDQQIDGVFDNNGNDGLVIGGDSTSPTNAPGRRFQLGRIIARSNTSHGVAFDASITGSNLPVPVWGSVTQILAEYNGGDGVIVTSSQYLDLGVVEANHNTAHGLDISSANVGFSILRARSNGQKGLALQGSAGSPNWGHHMVGILDLSGNTPDDTITLGSPLATCSYAQTGLVPPQPLVKFKTAATTRSNTATLTDDPDLAFASVAIGTYLIDGFIPYDATTTEDFVFGFDVPTGSTIVWSTDGPTGGASSAGATQVNRAMSTSTTGGPNNGGVGAGSSNGLVALPKGLLTITTAGPVALKWAQNVAAATNCTVEAGAWLRLIQVA